MAQQEVDSKVGDIASGKSEAGLSCEDKPLPVAVKKTPLRELPSENNIVPQKGSSNPPVLKEVVAPEALKVAGVKRPSPGSPMSPPQQSSSNNGANGHLVYVRRKSEAETGKNVSNEVIIDNTNSPLPSRQEDGVRPKMQLLPAYAPTPGSVMSVPSGKPFIPLYLGNSTTKAAFEDPKTQAGPSDVTSPVESRLKKQNWEERYVELQMYLKKLDQSSLEDHLQLLRSFSAVELSRHAVELEKQAIQLSLEQGKELQRVKALNVLGKSLKTSK
ncbi:Membrane-associated protein TcaA [Bienertia sinuspersici]